MQKIKIKLSKSTYLKKAYLLFKQFKFELTCFLYDLLNIRNAYKKSKEEKTNHSEVVFICSLPFFYQRRWQVVSQADLWHDFVSQENCLICGSFLSYWLFARHKKTVISLEPKYAAPCIKFSKRHIKTFVMISDSHSKSWLPRYIVKNNITDVITPYKMTLEYTGFHKPLAQSRVHSLPWCVLDKLLDDVKVCAKDNVVLGFGQTGGRVYDLREWSFNTGVLASFNYAGSGNQKFSGDAYYHWLRTYDACVVAVSSDALFNCPVAKFFEVPSQGLLLFGFKTVDLESFGFVDGINYIEVTKENFLEKIKDFKNNPESYLQIRRNGFELIKARHTVSKRLEQLQAYLKS
ncbi:glycosyltransferase [Aeromonas salmonicida]|uniref:glycosyltransferase n=1 Tax=Aeromonas salmonicida TaxID=645 RepID=UPI0031FDF1DD